MKFKLGDKINIKYNLNDITIDGLATITYIENDLLYTCGHCFPKNASTIFGDLIYSSGFDTKSESQEIAIIKIKKNKLNFFSNFKLSNNFNYNKNCNTVLMINNNKVFIGKIITKIDSKFERKNWQNIPNTDYTINHQIDKLDTPFFLIEHQFESKPGFSGSPWITKQNNNWKLVGSHIGSTDGMKDNKLIKVIYVKPIKIEN